MSGCGIAEMCDCTKDRCGAGAGACGMNASIDDVTATARTATMKPKTTEVAGAWT